jgi:hypothetical protein
VDRRRTSLVLLLLFVLCTGVAIVVSGSRPASEPGLAPALVQAVGYGCALVAGLLLVSGTSEGNARRLGGVVLGALAVLVLLDLLVPDDGGANIGAGFVTLVALVVIMVATIRLALAAASAGRAP